MVDLFIWQLETCVSFFLSWVKDAPTLQDHIDEVRTTLKNLKETQRQLKRISENKFFIPRIYSVHDDIPREAFSQMASARQTAIKAAETLEPLDFFITNFDYELKRLEALPRFMGKPSADLNSGLVEQIGVLLRDILKIKLSTYAAESHATARGGLFYRVVKTVFKILELPSENPRRLVKNAVNSLSEK
jgi:hypothetical protein